LLLAGSRTPSTLIACTPVTLRNAGAIVTANVIGLSGQPMQAPSKRRSTAPS